MADAIQFDLWTCGIHYMHNTVDGRNVSIGICGSVDNMVYAHGPNIDRGSCRLYRDGRAQRINRAYTRVDEWRLPLVIHHNIAVQNHTGYPLVHHVYDLLRLDRV